MIKKVLLAKEPYHYEQLGIHEDIEIWEDALRTNGDKGSFEWWYFDAEYSNGYKVVVIFYTKDRFNVNGLHHPTASIDITLPDGNSLSQVISDGNKMIYASKDKCDVKIQNSSIKYENGRYIIDFIFDDFEYSCLMTPTTPMWRPETGHIYFGDKEEDYFAWLVPVPSATVDATLRCGNDVIYLKGTGYHDHNWGNVDMKSIIDNWYWCHSSVDNYTAVTFDIICNKKYGYERIPLMVVFKDDVVIADNNSINVKREETSLHPISNKFVDDKITFYQNGSDNLKYKAVFSRKQDLIIYNLLSAFGLSKFKMNLYYLLKIRPTFTRTVGEASLIISDENNNIIHEAYGNGLWEQMFFGNNDKFKTSDKID